MKETYNQTLRCLKWDVIYGVCALSFFSYFEVVPQSFADWNYHIFSLDSHVIGLLKIFLIIKSFIYINILLIFTSNNDDSAFNTSFFHGIIKEQQQTPLT